MRKEKLDRNVAALVALPPVTKREVIPRRSTPSSKCSPWPSPRTIPFIRSCSFWPTPGCDRD